MPHLKFVIAGVLIIGATAFLMYSGINDSMIYYYGVSEVLAKTPDIYDKGIRLSGHVEEGSIQVFSRQATVTFEVVEKETEAKIPVTFTGDIPDTFKDHAEVVVEGQYRSTDQTFHATTLLAKCPSKYEAMEEEEGYSDSKAAEPITE